MKEDRDFALIHHINVHFNELINNLDTIDDCSAFSESVNIRKSILFDFLQIGELVNQLSDKFIRKFNNENTKKLIAVRNRIVHGYSSIKDSIIFNTLKNDLPLFIEHINEFANNAYVSLLKNKINTKINIVVNDNITEWEINNYRIVKGYSPSIRTLTGEFQEVVVVLDNTKSIDEQFVVVDLFPNSNLLVSNNSEINKDLINDILAIIRK